MDKRQLRKLGLVDLKTLRIEIDQLITAKQEEAKTALLDEFRAKAEELGLSLADLVPRISAKAKVKVAPKYRHPEDPAKTWAGRGRKPNWVLHLMDEGRSLEDLLI